MDDPQEYVLKENSVSKICWRICTAYDKIYIYVYMQMTVSDENRQITINGSHRTINSLANLSLYMK